MQPKGGLSSQVLDLLAYDGYKFVGYVSLNMLQQTSTDALSYSVIITLVAGLLGFGRTLYLLVFIYTFLSTAFFLVRLRSRPIPLLHPFGGRTALLKDGTAPLPPWGGATPAPP